MHRSALITLLQAYEPVLSEEQISKQTILDFVKEQPSCFERFLEVGHITASCWLVNKDNSHALLTHHAKLGKWLQLGGHCDGDSDVLRVAIKEAQEESGIMAIEPVMPGIFDLDVHLIPANSREKEHHHYDVRFLLQVASDEQIVVSDESHALAWIPKDRTKLPNSDRAVVRMFDKWIMP